MSFGDLKGAQQWLAETECPFPMLLDPQRKVEVFLRILTLQTINLIMVNAEAHFCSRESYSTVNNVFKSLSNFWSIALYSKNNGFIILLSCLIASRRHEALRKIKIVRISTCVFNYQLQRFYKHNRNKNSSQTFWLNFTLSFSCFNFFCGTTSFQSH